MRRLQIRMRQSRLEAKEQFVQVNEKESEYVIAKSGIVNKSSSSKLCKVIFL